MIVEAALLLGAILAGPVNHVVQTRKLKRVNQEIEENNRRIAHEERRR